MSRENLQEELPRETELKEFIFPNQYPIDQIIGDMKKILGHRFVDPRIETEVCDEEGMGTIWHVQVSFKARKSIKQIEDMEYEELELELLTRDHLPEEF